MSSEKKIFNERLRFRANAVSKVNSLENIEYQPKVNDKQIYTEYLPWLRYNKPNLPESLKQQINKKQLPQDQGNTTSTSSSVDSNLGTPKAPKKVYFPKINHKSPDGSKIDCKQYKDHWIKFPNEADSKKKDPLPLEDSIGRSKDLRTPKVSIATQMMMNAKAESPNNQPKTCDACTETVKETLVSVEVQTKEEPIKKRNRKLHKALKVSNTYESPSYLSMKMNKRDQSPKVHRPPPELKEEVITSRVIETFLPSLMVHDKENHSKPTKSYFDLNNKKDLRTNESMHLVTHAGKDFLDRYWASQRWLLLNKEPNGYSRVSEDYPLTEYELQSKPHPKTGKHPLQKDETSFKNLYRDRIQYYTEGIDGHLPSYNPNIDRVTSRDLEKIVL